MFNWLTKKNKNTTYELASIKYSVTSNKSLACEIKITTFDELSANCFSKLLLLLEQGEVIGVTIEALQMLHESKIEEQTQFVNQVLEYWQAESDKIIQPFIKPTDVFKEK